MQPPPSYTQSILERAEAIRSTVNTLNSNMALPNQSPPPYTSTPHLQQQVQAPFPGAFSIPASAFLDLDSGVNYSDDEDEDEDEDDDVNAGKPTQAPAPIVIKIDTSMKIDGHGNTILLPSTGAGPPGLRPAATAPASRALPVPEPEANPTNSNANTSQPQTQTTTGTQTPPSHSPSPTAIAASILLVLRAASLLIHNPNHYISPTSATTAIPTSLPIASTNLASRPIEISIDASIKVRGSRNLITRGGNGGLKILRKPGAATATTVDKNIAAPKTGESVEGETRVLGVQNGNGNERKRRAESEPVEPTNKKVHV